MPPRPGPERRFFDLWSHFYDGRLIQRLTYQPAHDAVLRTLRRGSHRRLLDVGCGTGLLASRVARELPGVRVVGCDFSRGMLRRASANGVDPEFVQGDALHLPFRDGEFDAVVSTEAFHWFPDQREALRELFRVLEPKGRLLLSLINPPFEAFSRATRTASHWIGEPLYWPTRRTMRRQAEAAGFHVEAQRMVFRVPLGLMMPVVLTVAVRPG